MSAGHLHHHSPQAHAKLKAELDDLLKEPAVIEYMERPYRVERIPVPLTGGSSTDGKVYYIDPDVGFRDVELVLWHERVEKALRAVKGMSYDRAHQLATTAEQERAGKGYGRYKRRISKSVRINERRGSEKLPKGFDLGPYRESGLMRLTK